MRLVPPNPTFLEAKTGRKKKSAVSLIGLPLDLTSSFRQGTARGPQKIREVSYSLESYSPRLVKDLSQIALFDWGDLVMPLSIEAAIKEIALLAERVFRLSKSGFFLGGEHAITIGIAQALSKLEPATNFLFLDAHLDARDSYENQKYSHAAVVRRVREIFPQSEIIILGARSGSKEEFEFVQKSGIYYSEGLFLPKKTLNLLKEKPLYLSLDIDVLDPSIAPGTGNPEPPGLSFSELLDFLSSLKGFWFRGMDLVEVSPPWDKGDLTSIVAAKFIREAVLLLC